MLLGRAGVLLGPTGQKPLGCFRGLLGCYRASGAAISSDKTVKCRSHIASSEQDQGSNIFFNGGRLASSNVSGCISSKYLWGWSRLLTPILITRLAQLAFFWISHQMVRTIVICQLIPTVDSRQHPQRC